MKVCRFLKLIGGADGTSNIGGTDGGCSWANKGGGGAKFMETEGTAGTGAGAGYDAVKLIGGADGTSNIGGTDGGCSWANKGGGGAKFMETEGTAGTRAGAGYDAVEDTPAQDITARDKAGAFAFKTTKSTLSGRSLLNCFKAFARSHESDIDTSNVLEKSSMYSASGGMRLKT